MLLALTCNIDVIYKYVVAVSIDGYKLHLDARHAAVCIEINRWTRNSAISVTPLGAIGYKRTGQLARSAKVRVGRTPRRNLGP